MVILFVFISPYYFLSSNVFSITGDKAPLDESIISEEDPTKVDKEDAETDVNSKPPITDETERGEEEEEEEGKEEQEPEINSDDERAQEQKEKDKQARAEASLREREKEVQRTLATHLRDRDKEREQHKRDEAIQVGFFFKFYCFLFPS